MKKKKKTKKTYYKRGGKLKTEELYTDDKLIEKKEYYKSGALEKLTTYKYIDQIVQMSSVKYFESGELYMKSYANKGIHLDDWISENFIYYNANGKIDYADFYDYERNLRRELNYKNGKLIKEIRSEYIFYE